MSAVQADKIARTPSSPADNKLTVKKKLSFRKPLCIGSHISKEKSQEEETKLLNGFSKEEK